MIESNKFIVVPIIALVVCQIIKFIVESIEAKQLRWGRLLKGSGGMPSSHTTFSFALTTLIMYSEGFQSPVFAVSLIFSLIVSYDAMGVRMESGRQAEAINDIVDLIFSKKMKQGFSHLKEELGHKPLEVLVGCLLGILVSTIFNFYIF